MEVQQQRTVGFRVTRWAVDVAHERLGRRGRTLQRRQHRDVRSVHHIRRDLNILKNLGQVTNSSRERLPFTVVTGCWVGAAAVVGGRDGVVVASILVHASRRGDQSEAQGQTRCRIALNGVHVGPTFHRSHVGVQGQLGRSNVGSIRRIYGLDRSHIPPGPRAAVVGLGRGVAVVAVPNGVQTIPALVAIGDRLEAEDIVQVRRPKHVVRVARGVPVQFLVYVVSARHLHHQFIRGGYHQNARGVGCKRVVRCLERHHRNFVRVQPVEVSQSPAQVDHELDVGAVARVVRHAQLHPAGSKTVVGSVRVAIHRFDHHRNAGAIAWIVPELRDGVARIVEDDVVVAVDRGTGVSDVAAGTFTKQTNFVAVDAVRVALLGDRLAEETNRRPAVLNPAVSRIDELVGALRLRGRQRIPAQTVIHRSHNVAHFGEARANLHCYRVRLGPRGATVHVNRQEVARVEIQQQGTVGLRVTSRRVDVADQRLRSGRLSLQSRQHRDVRAVNDIRLHVHTGENLIQVTHLGPGRCRAQEQGDDRK